MPDDAVLGVIRLDYDYPPIPGDVDCPDSFSYDVIYRTVPGLTFEMAQSGRYEKYKKIQLKITWSIRISQSLVSNLIILVEDMK